MFFSLPSTTPKQCDLLSMFEKNCETSLKVWDSNNAYYNGYCPPLLIAVMMISDQWPLSCFHIIGTTQKRELEDPMPVGQRPTCRCSPWHHHQCNERHEHCVAYIGAQWMNIRSKITHSSPMVKRRERAKPETGFTMHCNAMLSEKVFQALFTHQVQCKGGRGENWCNPAENKHPGELFNLFPFFWRRFEESTISFQPMGRAEGESETRDRLIFYWWGVNPCCCRFSAKEGATRSDKARPSTRLKVSTSKLSEIKRLGTWARSVIWYRAFFSLVPP